MPTDSDSKPAATRDSPSAGWGASTHLAYREWAHEALGDERQVYARSTAADRRLVFLPDGAADELREAAQSGKLVCPVPGCPSPRLTTRGPATRRHHFVHLQAPPDPGHQRAYTRRVATELIADWIRGAHPRSTIETDATVGEATIAALVTGPSGLRFALMFIDHRLGVDAWWSLDYQLERADMIRGWIFAPRRYLRYPQSSPDAADDDRAGRDRGRGDIALDRALFREMRHAGHWPLLLNITNRQLANLIVPRGRIARRLGLTPPASGDRVLHLVTTPLQRCRLCRDGIQTPAVGADVLAAPRHARERQQAALQALRPATANRAEPASSMPPPPAVPPRTVIPTARSLQSRLLTELERQPVLTLATLTAALQLDADKEDKLLREHLYNLRIERVIEFDRPLQQSSTIRLA